MTKRFSLSKLLPVWVIISSVIIVAGIVLGCLFGFAYSNQNEVTFEVNYTYMEEEKVNGLKDICKNAFEQQNVKYCGETVSEGYYGTASTSKYVLSYQLDGKTSAKTLEAIKSTVDGKLAADPVYIDVSANGHVIEAQPMVEQMWRGAIAIAVGVIVACAYIAIRFGFANAIAALIASVHGSALSLAILTVARIPVPYGTPLIVAAVACALSIALWVTLSVKMRESFKDPSFATLSAEDAVGQAYGQAKKAMFIIVGVLAIAVLALGLIATAGVRAAILPVILSVAVGAYTALVLVPAVYVPLKAKLGKKSSGGRRYVGKEKAEDKE